MHRTVPTILVMLIPWAYVGILPYKTLYLIIACIACYAAAGVDNSVMDRDEEKIAGKINVAYMLYASAILISSFNWIILISSLIWVACGIIYNRIARKVPFGDASMIAFSHFAFPLSVSSYMSGLGIQIILLWASFLYAVTWLAIHTKNLKDTGRDGRNRYWTLTTRYEKGRIVSVALFIISVLLTGISPMIFGIGMRFFASYLLLIMIGVITAKSFLNGKDRIAVMTARLYLALFPAAIVISISQMIWPILAAMSLLFVLVIPLGYSIVLMKGVRFRCQDA